MANGSAKIKSIPAPIGGWNVRDSIDMMPEEDALTLDNWVPRAGKMELRGGYTSYATTLGGAVRTLAEFSIGATRKFIAAANGNIWDISSAGAGSSLASGFANDYWQSTTMNSKMVLVNGADAPQEYDGSTVGAATISGSGLTVADLANVTTYKSRNYYCESGSLSFWYTAVNAHAGALTEFPLSRVTSMGGYLMAIGTWTRDSGSGPDDVFVAITSMGEVIVYSGSDPSTDFSLIGRYYSAPPIGRRCTLNVGGELIFITKDGYVPVSTVIGGLRSDKSSVSDKIRGKVVEDAKNFGGNQGWEAVFYPRGGYALFNVPLTVDSTYQQHVVNTSDNPGAWARFTGWNARCFATYNDRLYFGGDSTVYLADDSGYSDGGGNIETDAIPAFNYMGSRQRIKQLTGVQPVIGSEGDLSISVAVATDFNTPSNEYITSTTTPSGAAWDAEYWDVPDWAGFDNSVTRNWQAANNIGYTATARIRTRTSGQSLSWYSQNWMVKYGGLL